MVEKLIDTGDFEVYPILETEHLILRKWQLMDLDDLYEYAKNPCVGSMAGWKPHESKEEAFNVIKYYIENDYRWALVLKESGKVIGTVNIKPDNNRGKYYAKLLSFALSADFWGKGYMTEAVKCVVKYVFEEMGVDILTAFHYPHNMRSKRVIEKCGFKYEGTIEQGSKTYDGQVFDSIFYSIIKSDYYNFYNALKGE